MDANYFFIHSSMVIIMNTNNKFMRKQAQPTTFDHINIKYIWGPIVNHMGTTCKQVYTLNKYHFLIFIYYKETIRKVVTHIN